MPMARAGALQTGADPTAQCGAPRMPTAPRRIAPAVVIRDLADLAPETAFGGCRSCRPPSDCAEYATPWSAGDACGRRPRPGASQRGFFTMADRDRAPRRPRPRRSRPAPPPAAVLELNGHAVEPVDPPPPPPTPALTDTVPLNAVPEMPASPPVTAAKAEAAGPQPMRTPVWAWRGATPAMPLAVLFEKPLVVAEEAPAAAVAAPEPAGPPVPAPAARRRGIERALLLAIPAAVALGVVILLSRALPEPSGGGAEALWWSVLAVAGLAILVILDLAARRLRPSVLAGAGLPRLGGGLGEMTLVLAAAALLAGAGILRLPASSGTAGTVAAVHTAVAP